MIVAVPLDAGPNIREGKIQIDVSHGIVLRK
jgi:hypothetical protein